MKQALASLLFLLALAAGPFQPALALEDSQSPLFTHLGTEDGLSHAAAQALLQDSAGFIWIGTQQGLNRYDGRRIEVFRYHPNEPGSLSNGWIYTIFEDREKRLWVGTDGGLNLFDPASKSFRSFQHLAGDRTSLLDNSVKAIFQDRDGSLWVGTRKGLSRWDGDQSFEHFISTGPTAEDEVLPEIRAIAQGPNGLIWVGTQNRGLSVLDPASGLAREFEYRAGEPDSTGDRYIRSLLIDREGLVWAGTRNAGISRVNPDDGSIQRLTSDGRPGSLSSNRIWKIYQDDTGQVWVGTEGGGLNLWRQESGSFSTFRADPADESSLGDDVVYDIMRDDGDVIWLATFNGISKWNDAIAPFTHFRHRDDEPHSLSNNKVSSFLELDDGTILVGTIGGGLNIWDTAKGSFQALTHQRDREDSLSDDMVMSLMLDTDGVVWVGTMQGGINLLAPGNQTFTQLKHDSADSSSLSSNAVSRILQDRQGRIWVSTFGGGLNRYLGDGRFLRYPTRPGSLYAFPTQFLVDIEESPEGHMWIASDGGGLLRFDPITEQLEVFQHHSGTSNSPSGNHLVSLLQGEDALWVGTRNTGLNRFQGGEWKHFGERDGLAGSAIYGLQQDRQSRLWISHNQGLSVFDPLSGDFTNFSRAHGLQGEDYINGAHLRTREGLMLFGGNNGFNLFDPAAVHENPYIPPVRLTGFNKFNREFLLPQPLSETKRIELEHTDSVIGFEFAALDYTDPDKNRYRYRLQGFDPDWVEIDGAHQATYTNLKPGLYTFKVQGSNNDGIWNTQGLAVDLFMPPPPWATWWAWLLYLAFLALLVLGAARVYRVSVQRSEQERQNALLEGLVGERTRELSDSLAEKDLLLKEVHHRVKNNMQVISSLLNIQASSEPDERLGRLLAESQQRIKSMALIHENLYRSDTLLEINFHEYIEMLAGGLVRSSSYVQVPVQLDLKIGDILLDIDTAVPCGLIINELVSNALQHAFVSPRPEPPRIEIGFEHNREAGIYALWVSDNGPGLPADIDIHSTPSMGLEIVRILTQQLKGKLELENAPGSSFRIEFAG